MSAVKILANLIFKKELKKQKGIMKILPGDKVNAEEKAKFALKKLQERGNINIDKLTQSDLEFIAEDIANPFKYAEKTPIKSADVIPFKFKRTFAEELADASKKGDFTRMKGIMKLDPKFKEVMKAFNKSKADEEAYKKMVGPKKLIPDRDVIPYQSPEVQKLNFAEKLKRAGLTEKEYMDYVVKRGYGVDDAIYARDFYGDTTEDIIRRAAEKGTPVAFADGGVAGLLGERTGFSKGKLANLARRNFMKLLGGVGAGIGALKTGILGFGKGASKQVAKEVVTTPNVAGKPVWFDKLVNRVILEGEDVTKQFAYKERMKVHTKPISKTEEVTIYRDLDDGSVRVNYGSKLKIDDTKPYERGNIGRASNDPDQIDLIVRKGEVIEPDVKTGKGGGKTKDSFEASEAEPRATGGPEDADMEFDGIREVDNVDDLMQDVSLLEEFATGKKLTGNKAAKAKKKREDFQRFTEDPVEQANYLEEKYGPAERYYGDPDDFASGGIARMLGE